MRFCELKEEEFRQFSSAHELRSFFQTPEIAKSKQEDGCNCYYVGVKENDKILCATLLIEYSGKLFKTFSSPRGYLIDYKDKKLLAFFTKEIKKFIKKKNGVVLNIEPNVLYKQRDIDGNIVEGGFDNSYVYDSLVDLGYKHSGFYLNLDLDKQIRWAFALDIANKTEEEVFEGFRPNTRNVIRKNLKYGVNVRELSYEELDKFYDIVESSGSRKNFHSRSLKYYQKMYRIFHDREEVKFLVSELNIDNYIKILNDEILELQKKLSLISDSGSNKGKQKDITGQINAAKERIEEAKELQKTYGNVVIMAGAMFMLYGGEIAYLFSGTKSQFMTLKSQFLLQWHIMQYGIRNNYKLHNFYGISGIIDKSDPRYGVYEFKRSFGGNVIEYIGDFDLIISPFKYYLRKIINKFGGK